MKVPKLRGILGGMLLAVAGISTAVVIQGEFTPGIYNNYSIDSFGRLPVVIAGGSMGMPTGASTEAKQDVGNSAIVSMESKTPALVGGAVPVTGGVVVSGNVGITGVPSVSLSGTPTVNIGTMPVAAPVSYSYRNISGTGNTVIKSGAGRLQALVVNTSGTLSNMVIYDNTSCTGNTIATIGTLVGQSPLYYTLNFNTGLCVSNNGTLAANITVVYN